MQKALIFLSIISICWGIKAQSFAPIGATWHYTEEFFLSGKIDYEKIESVKDTIIQNKLCKKLAKRHGFISLYEPMNDLFVYSNADTVFMYEPNMQSFQTIYIFSAPMNSSYSFLIHPNPMFSSPPYLMDTVQVSIDSVGSVMMNNQSISVQHVSYAIFLGNKTHNSSHSYQSIIYNKIGDLDYLTNFWAFRSMVFDGNSSGGIRCYQDSIQGLTQFTTDSCNHASNFVGIDESKNVRISIYPNPVSQQLFIKGLESDDLRFQINNVVGKRVKDGLLKSDILVQDLPSGVYFLSLLNEFGEVNKSFKFVKE